MGASDSAVIDLGDSGRWRRDIVETPWMSVDDELGEFLRPFLEPHLDGCDFVAVTEKVVSLASGLSVDTADVSVGALARFLARRVRPRGNSLALSVPEKMQWVVDELGVVRTLLAALVSAITRPFGYEGAFYVVAGEKARSVDGARGAYPETLLPPLTARLGAEWCGRLAEVWQCPVAIIDMNDRGGSVRAVSHGLDIELVARITADNPLGSGVDSTPAAVVTAVADRST